MSELTDDRLLPCPFCGYALSNDEGLCIVPDKDGFGDEYEDGRTRLSGVCCPGCAAFLPLDNLTMPEAIARWNRRAAVSTSTEGAGVKFEGIAKRKLDDLVARGWAIDGYAITKDGKHGFVTTGAFVGWWLPDQGMPSERPASKVTTDEAEERE